MARFAPYPPGTPSLPIEEVVVSTGRRTAKVHFAQPSTWVEDSWLSVTIHEDETALFGEVNGEPSVRSGESLIWQGLLDAAHGDLQGDSTAA